MINLDERYHSYLMTDKCFYIDGICEKLKGYGYNCNSTDIIGYYVLTTKHKLYYNLDEKFLRKEVLPTVPI